MDAKIFNLISNGFFTLFLYQCKNCEDSNVAPKMWQYFVFTLFDTPTVKTSIQMRPPHHDVFLCINIKSNRLIVHIYIIHCPISSMYNVHVHIITHIFRNHHTNTDKEIFFWFVMRFFISLYSCALCGEWRQRKFTAKFLARKKSERVTCDYRFLFSVKMSTRQERFERRMARKCTDVIDDEKLPATKRNTKTGQTKRKNIHGIVALERAAGEPAPRPTSINKANLKLAEASHTPVLRSPRPIHRMTGEKTKAIAPPANELDTGNESTTSNAKPGRVYGVAVFHKRTRLLQPMNTTNSRVAEAHGRRVSNSKISDNVIIKTEPKSPVSLYSQLQALADRGGYITNADDFECIICMTMIDVGDGVRLRQCLHQFCLDCLKSSIVLCDEAEIPCPFGDGKIKCESTLLDSEIRAILSSDEYEKHLQRSLRYAEGTIQNTIHCKLVDCDGWCICEDNVNQFDCPKCKSVNCVSCQVHAAILQAYQR